MGVGSVILVGGECRMSGAGSVIGVGWGVGRAVA